MLDMHIKPTEGEEGAFDVIDKEGGHILTINKKVKAIVVWQDAVDSTEKDAVKQNKEQGKWLILRKQ